MDEIYMKKSIRIFLDDLHSIRTNLITMVVIGGLIFLPSLYAWLNIWASWDPYSQTNQLPVGLVNEDEGVVLRDEPIDVGRELVDTLKENDSLDWHFIDRDQAVQQLEKGKLFAYIVIPKNFSEKLGTVVDVHPEKAKVEYYVNEKINAIAPKITEKGASVIVEDISRNFIEEVNKIIFEIFNEVGLELEEELPDIRKFEKYVFDLEENLPEIHELLAQSLEDAKRAREIAAKGEEELSVASKIVNTGLDTIEKAINHTIDTENFIHDFGPTLSQNMKKVENSIGEIHDLLEDIGAVDDGSLEQLTDLDQLQNQLQESIDYIDGLTEALEIVLSDMKNSELPNETQIKQLEKTIEELNDVKKVLTSSLDNTMKVANSIEQYEEEIKDIIEKITDLTSSANIELDELESMYEKEIEPLLLSELERVQNLLLDAKDVLTKVEATIPEIEEMLARTLDTLTRGEELLDELLKEFPYVNDKVTELAKRIRKVQDQVDINQIIELLKQDPDSDKSFFTEPVVLKENTMFPIENYGSGMTPFYTVLSLWVGGLLLISILSTNVQEPELFHAREIYFGKWFLFILIGVLQTLIVTMGDLHILGVKVANPVWFVLFGFIVSLTFMTIIYTFVSIFGDVGKALAIIMLVLQIAGSGGTYPVALLPKFFQAISPFLPFTYAVGLMREAVGGIVWSNALFDILMLVIFITIALLLGAFLKDPINRSTQKLMGESKESNVFQ